MTTTLAFRLVDGTHRHTKLTTLGDLQVQWNEEPFTYSDPDPANQNQVISVLFKDQPIESSIGDLTVYNNYVDPSYTNICLFKTV